MENPAVRENNPMDPYETYKRNRPKRVRMFKDDVVAENERLKMRVSELEKWIKNFKELPTMRRVMLAINVNKEGTP